MSLFDNGLVTGEAQNKDTHGARVSTVLISISVDEDNPSMRGPNAGGRRGLKYVCAQPAKV